MFSSEPEIAKRQMLAVVFMLTAFGHADGKFGLAEKRFVQEKIAALVERQMQAVVSDPLVRHAQTARVTAQFQRAAAAIDRELVALLSESVAEGESQEQFISAKITLRCYELLRPFDEDTRGVLFDIVDELILADGVAHPAEEKLRRDLERLLAEPVELTEFELLEDDGTPRVELLADQPLIARVDDHPFFTRLERAYPYEPQAFAEPAQEDVELVRKVRATLAEQRAHGSGRLTGMTSFAELDGAASFLDQHVYVLLPDPAVEYELIVLGDLHGCYSCLKAALMQTDFLAKVQAHADSPSTAPDTRLVLLGDYIDRGRYSYDGILRTVLQLYAAAPHAVHILRGNHEFYLEHQGRILAPVRPSEGMSSLAGIATDAFFNEFRLLFEELPTTMSFGKIFFSHAGIPRDASLRDKWKDLSSLNDPELRFEMMWSDPADTEVVPDELQKKVARFGYGSAQFRNFMARIGASVMIRGHERIEDGFEAHYDFPESRLFTLFSAGGASNPDLPDESNYREVTPRGLTIRWQAGACTMTPFPIAWDRYSDPARNRFLA